MKSIPSKFCKWFELTPDEQNEIHLRGDTLTIQQIGEFIYHSEINRKERLKLYRLLADACERGMLKHRGDITNWQVKHDEINKKVGSGEFSELTWENCWEVTNPPNCKIHKDDLKRYLQFIDLWPVENCLLANWWADDESVVKDCYKMEDRQVEEVEGSQKKTKDRKRLKPKERDSTEGLLLIYELCNCYGISYWDELPGKAAWGKIVSGEFTSNLIKSIAENKKSIELKGDGRLNKSDFLEKYRKRFV
jgi:hypothetical protein